MRGPRRPATSASTWSSGSSSKPTRTMPCVALDDEQAADRGAQAGEDGVGEALAHGGGGDGLEQGVGERGHAASLSRSVRTAVDTRWRAATAEMPSRSAMPS